MFSKLKKLLSSKGNATASSSNKKKKSSKTKERRKTQRLKLPDTTEASKHVRLGKASKKKTRTLPTGDTPDIKLSAKEHKAEEKAAKKALKEKLNRKDETEEDDSPFGFSIELDQSDRDEVHQAIAVSFPGLAAACAELKKAVRVKDISTTGVALKFEKPRVKGGTILTLLFATKEKRFVSGVKAKVMRHEKGVLGARFIELSRQQENVISKLVLEGQKMQGRMRKKRTLPKEIQDLKL